MIWHSTPCLGQAGVTGKTTIDSILTVGKKHLFKHYCIPGYDSVIHSGTIVFSDVRIGIVESCTYEETISDDTLRKIVITTNRPHHSAELLTQAVLQYGFPSEKTVSRKKSNVTYTWAEETNVYNRVISKKLTFNKNGRKAGLVVQIEK